MRGSGLWTAIGTFFVAGLLLVRTGETRGGRSGGFHGGSARHSGSFHKGPPAGSLHTGSTASGAHHRGRHDRGDRHHGAHFWRSRGLLYPYYLGYPYGVPYDSGVLYGYEDAVAPEPPAAAPAALTEEEVQLARQWRDYRRRHPDRYATLAAADARIRSLMERADAQLGPE